MATIREGNTGVLIVVDVQVGVLAGAWQAETTIGRVARAVERARGERVPVIWVQHQSDEELAPGSAAWQWVPELAPAPGEPLLPKRYNSAFEATALDAELARLGATHIVLAGAASNWCIRATAYGALDRGYDLTLISDAHTTSSMDVAPGRRVEAAGVIEDLNLAMTWLSYPGRLTGTATAEAVDFHTPGGAPKVWNG